MQLILENWPIALDVLFWIASTMALVAACVIGCDWFLFLLRKGATMLHHEKDESSTPYAGDSFLAGLEHLIRTCERQRAEIYRRDQATPALGELDRIASLSMALQAAKRRYLLAIANAEKDLGRAWINTGNPLERTLGRWLHNGGEWPLLDELEIELEPGRPGE